MPGSEDKPKEDKHWQFKEGNRWWQARSRHGRKAIWESPEELLEACEEYFHWNYSNPLEEAVCYQGEVKENAMPKMRAMTIGGLCVYLGIVTETWKGYRKRDDFISITKMVDEVIRTQKFEGAAAGMLNPLIISRDLGLKDAIDTKIDGKLDTGPNVTTYHVALPSNGRDDAADDSD